MHEHSLEGGVIVKQNIIGTTTANGYPFLSLKERFAIYQKLGYRSVMLWWGENDKDTRDERVSLAKEYNLQIENVHSDMEHCNSLWIPGSHGDKKTQEFIKAIKDCYINDIRCMVIHLTNGSAPPEISDIGLHRLEHLFECAIKHDVVLAIENVPTDQHIRYVLDHYRDRHIAFCYDSGHANAWCKDVDWLSLYGDRLAAVHLHDNNGIEDQHIPPFMGTIDWVKVMQRIKCSSYEGCLTLETEYRGKEDISQLEDFLSKSYQKAADLAAL